MDYKKLYDALIAFRQVNLASGYTENHHIVMRSMGGSNDKENLVKLTGREHWVVHLLLYKIHKNKETAHACHMMAMRCEERGIPYVRNSRMYETIRKECARLASIRMKKRIGEKNSMFGKRWICNIELKENKVISKNEEIPEGWILGRNKWFLSVERQRKNANKHKKEELDLRKKETIFALWEDFISSKTSLRKFALLSGYNVRTLSNWFSNHIPSYKDKILKSFKEIEPRFRQRPETWLTKKGSILTVQERICRRLEKMKSNGTCVTEKEITLIEKGSIKAYNKQLQILTERILCS
jgi:hypothetical protein